MSVTWRPAPPEQHLCAHRRCILAGRIGAALMIAAFLSMAPLLMAPSWQWCAVTGGLLAAAFAAIYWPCPRHGDLEALIEATREPRPPVTRYEHAGQPFRGLGGHFEQWERELKQ